MSGSDFEHVLQLKGQLAEEKAKREAAEARSNATMADVRHAVLHRLSQEGSLEAMTQLVQESLVVGAFRDAYPGEDWQAAFMASKSAQALDADRVGEALSYKQRAERAEALVRRWCNGSMTIDNVTELEEESRALLGEGS